MPMKNFKQKKPAGTTLVLILLSLLCIAVYDAIAVGWHRRPARRPASCTA